MKSRAHPLPTFSTGATLEALEWEEMPSLIGRVHAATARAEAVEAGEAPPAWEATMPAALDTSEPAEPFRETLHGLAVREVREPDLFRHFFGAGRG